MKPSERIIELEKEVWDKFNEYFPKTKISTQKELQLRSKALVILIMAKELGVQGHADNIKQNNQKEEVKE